MCPLCGEKEDLAQLILKCSEAKLWSKMHIKNGWENLVIRY
jgi:hypothetical protein